MGTSQSKPPAQGGSPLIPSWADQDPPPADQPQPPQPPNQEPLEPRRNFGLRRSLGRYYATGDKEYARSALGHFSRGSMGGGVGAEQRLARAARVGGGAFAMLASASTGQAMVAGGLDLNALTGAPVSDAISAIVDTFCPPGILDEEAIRAAMSEALAEAMEGLDKFDPAQLDPYAVLVATRCFVAELVFNAVIQEQGDANKYTTPQLAIARENALRDLVREITDIQATPILQNSGGATTPAQIEGLVKDIAVTVYEAMADED